MANKLRPSPGGAQVGFNITAATLLKSTPGVVFRVYINTAPSGGTGAVYDSATVAGIGAANLITEFPSGSSTQILEVIAPYYAGLVVDPGTGGVVSVSYE